MSLEGATAVANEPSGKGLDDGQFRGTLGKRRSFAPEDKARIIEEASRCCSRGQLSALLRREGISYSHLTTWRRRMRVSGVDGLAPKRPGPTPRDDTRDLLIEKQQRAISALERELLVVNALVEMQRKGREALVEMQRKGREIGMAGS